MTRPLLSLCMIVKDEEEMLTGCLNSIHQYVDEIIIVDTGSSDRTVEIAQNFKAKIFFHPWKNDFSKHRNQAIAHAVGRWIIMMDADEELKRESGEILRASLTNENCDSIELTNICVFNRGASEGWIRQVRIFRNSPSIYYSDTVHERLIGLKNTKTLPIFLYHRGYDLEKTVSERKHQRNIGLIKEQITKDPDNYIYHLNLAVSYATHFEYDQSFLEGVKAVQLAGQKGLSNSQTLRAKYIVSSSSLKMGDFENAEKYALMSLDQCPEDLDSLYILLLASHQKKDWPRLSEISTRLLNLFDRIKNCPEQVGSRFIHMANEEWRIHLALGDMHLNRQDLENACRSFEKAKALTPVPAECEQITGDCFRRLGWLDQAEKYYRSSLDLVKNNSHALFGMAMVEKARNRPDRYREIILSLDSSEANSHDLHFEKGLIHLRDRSPDQAIYHFNMAVRLRPGSFHAYLNLAMAYKYAGKIDLAVKYNLRAVELKPEAIDPRINLGYIYYELKKYNDAKKMFESALTIDPHMVDLRLLLCEIYLFEGDLEGCVNECDRVFKSLGHPLVKTLNSLADLSDLFFIIGRLLLSCGNPSSEKAFELALHLDHRIVERFEPKSGSAFSEVNQP